MITKNNEVMTAVNEILDICKRERNIFINKVINQRYGGCIAFDEHGREVYRKKIEYISHKDYNWKLDKCADSNIDYNIHITEFVTIYSNKNKVIAVCKKLSKVDTAGTIRSYGMEVIKFNRLGSKIKEMIIDCYNIYGMYYRSSKHIKHGNITEILEYIDGYNTISLYEKYLYNKRIEYTFNKPKCAVVLAK